MEQIINPGSADLRPGGQLLQFLLDDASFQGKTVCEGKLGLVRPLYDLIEQPRTLVTDGHTPSKPEARKDCPIW